MKLFRLTYEVGEWGEDGQFEAENNFWYKTVAEAEQTQKEINESKEADDFDYKNDPDGMYGYDIDDGCITEVEVPMNDEAKMLEWIRENCGSDGARPYLAL